MPCLLDEVEADLDESERREMLEALAHAGSKAERRLHAERRRLEAAAADEVMALEAVD